MKKINVFMIVGITCFATVAYAGNGDLVVNGNINTGTGITFADGSTQTTSCKMNVVSNEFTDIFSTTSKSFVDVPGFAVTIIPSSPQSKILVMGNIVAGMNGGYSGAYRIVRGIAPIAVPPAVTGYQSVSSQNFYSGSTTSANNEESSVIFLDSPGTVSPVTYQVQVASFQGAAMKVNALGSDIANQVYSLRTRSSLTLMEIK